MIFITTILSYSFGIILLSSFIKYNSSKLIITRSLFLNLLLFQYIFLWIGMLDYNNLYNMQSVSFNSLNSLLLTITQNPIWDNMSWGIDTISLLFVILTVFLTTIALAVGLNTTIYGSFKYFVILVQIIQCMLLITFLTTDLFIFYIGFEALTIPTFLLIFIYGAEITKLRAAKLFLIYSFVSSTFLSFGIILLYTQYQTTSLNQLIIQTSLIHTITAERFLLIFLLLFISFGIKIPIYPFHMWLPEAHAEASTAGSVILAGLILKLGGYGLIRFVLPIFGTLTYLNPYIQVTCIISIFFTLGSCLRTTNLKQIIAFTSIIHMNIITLGLFSSSTIAITGSIVSLVSHSLVSSALFISIGTLYNRYHSYELQYYSNLSQTMPIFSVIFVILMLSNIAFPLTLSFIGEYLLLIGFLTTNIFISLLLIFLICLNIIYSLWIVNRIIYQDLTGWSNSKQYIHKYQDLDLDEILVLSILIALIVWLGISPNHLLTFLLI